MNHRERALAAMCGQPVDRIPFIARMELWHGYHQNQGTLPHPYEKASLWEMQRDLGIGIFGFGAYSTSFYRLTYPGVEVEKTVQGEETIVRYHTPFGTLTCRDVMAEELKEAAGSAARVEYPFKCVDDYDALQYLIEHAEVKENFDEYGEFTDEIGTDGLAVPWTGQLPAHQLMIFYMGYQTFYYELHDHPARVEALIQALTYQHEQIVDLAICTPAQALEIGGNYDEMMTPPPVFERFFAPYYRRARQKLDKADKVLVIHGDGEMRHLLTNIRDCGVQVVEALTPEPMTTINVAKTRRLWQDRVAMWGGLSTVILTDAFSEGAFEQFLDDLFTAVVPGDRFILGFGDNVPTDASFGRVKRIVQYWQEHGGYPLQPVMNSPENRD